MVEPRGDVGVRAQVVAARDFRVDRIDEVDGEVAADETVWASTVSEFSGSKEALPSNS